MKTIKNRLKSLAAAALLTGLAMNFNACSEQSPLNSETQDAEQFAASNVSTEIVLDDGPLSEE